MMTPITATNYNISQRQNKTRKHPVGCVPQARRHTGGSLSGGSPWTETPTLFDRDPPGQRLP